ncbi:MAG: SpoIIE family protein phosphatase [Gemmatimonadota bacterium]|nr:SpoIIE family protein phosphatase [Gemmatimonadota bacterium]
MELSIGDTVDRYVLVDKIGEGGMGVVFRARDTRLDRDVALKFLPADLARDEASRERLVREARAAASLQHPAICPVYEVNEHGDVPYIAMAVAEGRDLRLIMEERTFGVDEAIRITIDVAAGRAAAHAQGIIHRDIKPANVMLTPDGAVRVLDFGIARAPQLSSLTTSGTHVGTAAYMAPEQLAGEGYDHRADIWGLGVLLYQLLTGTLPFRGKTAPALLYAVVSSVPEPVSALRANLPLGVEYVLNKALAKKPQDRYQSVAPLKSDLEALLEAEGEPRPMRDAPRSRKGGSTPSDPPTHAHDGDVVRLLIVDDEPDLELLMRQHFRKRIRSGELEVTFASDGREALTKLEEDPRIEMVLTDIRMPVMDGLAFLGELTDLDRAVKAVVVSAYGDFGNIRTAMNRGAFDFLIKPIDFADLEATIDKTLAELARYREAREVRRRLSVVEQEMDVARRIRSAVVPRAIPSPEGVDRYVFATPAPDGGGGDFHDFFELGDGRVGVVVGEVFGSGVGSAVYAAVNRTLLKALARPGVEPSDPLRDVDRLLQAEGLNALSVTALFGLLDVGSGEFRYSTAGHPHPYRIDAEGKATLLSGPTAPPLGTVTSAGFETVDVHLAPGEGLFLYTDGIPDARKEDRIFSHTRLEDVLSGGPHRTPAQVVRDVVRAVDDFCEGWVQPDDATAFALRRTPERSNGA